MRVTLVSSGLAILFVSAGALASNRTEELYTIYCSSCHNVKNAEAPEAFNVSVWSKRLAKGTDIVVTNAIKGIGNMPPQGTCFECAPADLRNLIRYMSSPQ
jgi:cytochrome c5